MTYLASAFAFLLQTLFECAIGLFLGRAILIAVNAPFNQPICRFVYTLTNPVVTPLRRALPRAGKIDVAALLVAFLLAWIEPALFAGIFGGAVRPLGWSLLAIATLAGIAIAIVFWSMVILCLASFLVPGNRNPNLQLLARVCEPVARPFRRLIPPVAGLDFSYLFASIALILVRLLILAPLTDFAASL